MSDDEKSNEEILVNRIRDALNTYYDAIKLNWKVESVLLNVPVEYAPYHMTQGMYLLALPCDEEERENAIKVIDEGRRENH